MQFLIIIFFIALAITGIVFAILAAKKRREALRALAHKLGMSFSPKKDRSIDDQYTFLDALKKGHNRYAQNIIRGSYREKKFTIFDYHYQTGSGKNTQHHNFSFFIMKLEKVFPELKITKEDFFSKIGQALGFDDIDFESHEFSKLFCVRAKNKKFAYDVCNAKMIDYLLDNRDMSIEIENNALALAFSRRLKAEQIEHNMDRLIKLRSLMPEYLFKG
jgi:hypothetical protein